MKKYIIPPLNGEGYIIDPVVTIVDLDVGNPILEGNPDFITKTIGILIDLKGSGYWMRHMLQNVKVETMALDDGSLLYSQVMSALDEQFLIVE